MREIQHFNVKVFAREPANVNWHDAIEVFHRWIQDGAEESLIDVADYAHVPGGPGVMLIGHEAFYSLDMRQNRLGLLYNQRTAIEGTTEQKLHHAYDAAVRACRRLEQEPEFRGKLSFDERKCEVFVNDRLLAPNTQETWSTLEPDIARVFSGAQLQWNGASRDLLRVTVSSVLSG